MEKKSKIYVAGHRGLAGSAILRKLESLGYENIVTRIHSVLDLCDQQATQQFFESEKPDYVFLAAAFVGGIVANDTLRAEAIYKNLMIQCNVVNASYEVGVKKLLFLGSSCIYPKLAPQPLKEEYLLSDYLEPTNEPYAVAKIAGIKLCESYNRQYGTDFMSVMPTNLYGPNDNYHPEHSHALPALIRKFHEAKIEKKKSVEVWGSGKPRREFLYSDDLADACVYFIENHNAESVKGFVNIGSGVDITIKDLALLIAEVIGFEGELVFDTSRPDGTPQKLLDVDFAKELGWEAKIELRDGIKMAYNAFVKKYYPN